MDFSDTSVTSELTARPHLASQSFVYVACHRHLGVGFALCACVFLVRTMTVLSKDFQTRQELLAAAWISGRKGTLSAWSEATVWALRELYLETHGNKSWGVKKWISKRVKKVGGGKPSPEAVGQLLCRMDDDSMWYQGKQYGSLGGRPPAISPTNRGVIARSAMAMARNGEEPTAGAVIARTPRGKLESSNWKAYR